MLYRTSYKENEVWIAYITSNPLPQEIPKNMSDYNVMVLSELLNMPYKNPDNYSDLAHEHAKKWPFSDHIKMFVTVTSNPNALITSHMGISFPAETNTLGKPKKLSTHLHSFGAKVMLMRNPKRKYMITSPTYKMEKIIVDALPENTVFLGTRSETAKERKNLKCQPMIPCFLIKKLIILNSKIHLLRALHSKGIDQKKNILVSYENIQIF